MTDEPVYLCGVVIEKEGELERFCTEVGEFAVPLMDENEVNMIDAIVLCQRHGDRFDEGHSLMASSRKGNRILIQLIPEEEWATINNEDSSPPVLDEDAPAPT